MEDFLDILLDILHWIFNTRLGYIIFFSACMSIVWLLVYTFYPIHYLAFIAGSLLVSIPAVFEKKRRKDPWY